MRSIKTKIETTITIKHSEFISILTPVGSIDEVKNHLNHIKEKHPNANHHCYAYIIGDHQEIQKANDDGEPTQTAGIPILEVFKKNEITNILCVVIRYFGGIKLGAGGLIRAYSKSASEALKLATLTSKKTYLTLKIQTCFDLIGAMEHHLPQYGTLLDREYSDKVAFTLEIKKGMFERLQNTIREISNNQANVKVISEKQFYN